MPSLMVIGHHTHALNGEKVPVLIFICLSLLLFHRTGNSRSEIWRFDSRYRQGICTSISAWRSFQRL